MRADHEIERDIQAELQRRPDVDHTDIAVKVTDGVATLTGFVPSDVQKYRAEAVAKRVEGVRGMANDLAVRPPPGSAATDPQIARETVAALKRELPTAWEKVQVLVDSGYVVLAGTLEWQYQREAAENAVHRVGGVVGVRNDLTIAT